MKRDRILGIPFDAVRTEDVLKSTERFHMDEKSRVIVFLSLPTLMMARRKKLLRIFLEEADIIIPSGKSIFRAAKLLRRTITEKIDPSQFVKRLLMQSVELNKSVYFLGGRGTTVERAYTNLKKEIPKLFVVGRYRGDYPKKNHEDIVTAIGKASPDYFFIGLGSPHEANWVEANRNRVNPGITILVGRLFDVFAGTVKKRYWKYVEPERAVLREIPQPGSFRRLIWLPVFFILVCFERLFWKHRP